MTVRSKSWRRPTSAFLAACCGVLLTACNNIAAVTPADHNHFEGITSLGSSILGPAGVSSSNPLRILIIHGMGTHVATSFDSFIEGIATRLGMAQITPSGCVAGRLEDPDRRFIEVANVQDPTVEAQLLTYRFAPVPCAAGGSPKPALTISFLLWSPLTSTIKVTELAESDGSYQRVPGYLFTDLAKDFIKDKLGDVVLYGGQYRQNILRPTVEKALCYFIGGMPSIDGKACSGGDDQTATVLVTHSLGGYMLMDAVDDELSREQPNPDASKARSAAAKMIASTQQIFMMANQLALLDLTTLNTYPYPAQATSPRAPAAVAIPAVVPTESAQVVRRFVREWAQTARPPHANPLDLGQPVAPGQFRQIVAFSDRNDILTYLVTPKNLGLTSAEADQQHLYLTNVYVNNDELAVPGVISWPVNAHTDYFVNPVVLDLFLCGMADGTPKRCPPLPRQGS